MSTNPLIGRQKYDELRNEDSQWKTEWTVDKAADFQYCVVVSQTEDFTPGVNLFESDDEDADPGKHWPRNWQDIAKALVNNGLEVLAYESRDINKTTQRPDVYMLVRVPVESLRKYGNEIEYKLLLDSKELKKLIERGNPDRKIVPHDIPNNDPKRTKVGPYEFIYAKYTSIVPEILYWRPEGMGNPFRNSIRLKMAALLMEKKIVYKLRVPFTESPLGYKIKTKGLNLDKLLHSRKILSLFPLHDLKEQGRLKACWLNVFRPWKLPFFKIKEYYGEKVALFYSFMGHYSLWLYIIAIIGTPIQLLVLVEMLSLAEIPVLRYLIPICSFCVVLWVILMMQYWLRKEKAIALTWGMIDYEKIEPDRAGFTFDIQLSLVNGYEQHYFSPSIHRHRYVCVSV